MCNLVNGSKWLSGLPLFCPTALSIRITGTSCLYDWDEFFLSVCDIRFSIIPVAVQIVSPIHRIFSLTTVVFAKLEELKLERRTFITVYSCASVQQRQSRSTLSASRGHLSARAELYSETERSSLE